MTEMVDKVSRNWSLAILPPRDNEIMRNFRVLGTYTSEMKMQTYFYIKHCWTLLYINNTFGVERV